MADSSYQKWSNNDTGQTPKDIRLKANQDGTYNIGTTSKIIDAMGRQAMSSTFGELVVGTRQNNINIPFSRNNGNEGLEENMKSTRFFFSGTGTQSNINETAFVETGSGIGYAEIRSKGTNRYVTGHGNDVFHTMVFPQAGEPNTYSWIGYGSLKLDNCLGFGKKDGVFGIWAKLRGSSLEDSFVPQSEWNINKLPEYADGNGIVSGNSLGWLGYADIDYYVILDNNEIVHVHKIAKNNKDNKPHISEPTLPMSIGCERISGSGGNITNGTSSWFAGTVGNRASGTGADKFPFIKRPQVTIPSNSETVLLNIRNRESFAGKKNTVRLRYGTVTITSDGTKPVEFNVYLNGVPYDTITHEWGYYDEQLSVSELNLDAPLSLANRTIVSGLTKINEQIGGTFLGKVDRDRINLFSTDVVISAAAGEILTFTAKSPNTTTVDFEIRWIEEF